MEEDMVDKDRDDPLQAATAASKPANTGKFEFSIAPLQ
uniref:Bm10614 n=2 Tax=Brugia TaxID=6278 RepID=A0A1I9G411_BRUMA|nr:Bm10614 [Brugia malayi]